MSNRFRVKPWGAGNIVPFAYTTYSEDTVQVCNATVYPAGNDQIT